MKTYPFVFLLRVSLTWIDCKDFSLITTKLLSGLAIKCCKTVKHPPCLSPVVRTSQSSLIFVKYQVANDMSIKDNARARLGCTAHSSSIMVNRGGNPNAYLANTMGCSDQPVKKPVLCPSHRDPVPICIFRRDRKFG